MNGKKMIGLIFSLPLLLIFTGTTCNKKRNAINDMTHLTYSYLALGDSYTIGESVSPAENFPNQVVHLMKKSGYDFHSPEIIAKTGWTTDELQTAINNHIPIAIGIHPPYDFVSLLIGVNNQYRGRKVENYTPEFESLLKQAIHFAGGNNKHVIVISIPDWGATPFAEGRDRNQIAKEIDEYNAANKSIAEKYKVNYINITPGTREASIDATLVAKDGLHPSAKEYTRWAEKISSIIKEQL
jgi:lysophospholipase L1-like esterase